MSETARRLGINRKTLNKKLKDYNNPGLEAMNREPS
ncbi:MAG: hypothetical protein K9J81_09950 [Desulfohalobiaceae bacterium]|nr:hypothetical protein [Desulfohalobiaceae bacterium]